MASLAAGTTVENVPSWLVVSASVVLMSGEQMELRTVSVVAGTTLTFVETGAAEWPIGTVVAPSLDALLAEEIQAQRRTNQVAEAAFRFEVTPGSEPQADLGVAEATYKNREVFLKRPNWAKPVSISETRVYEQIDYGVGKIETFLPITFGTRLHKAGYVGRDAAAATALLQFFLRMMGQAHEFYLPTWEPDLLLGTPVAVGDERIRLDGLDFYEAMHDDTVYRAIMAVFRNGTRLFNKVTSIGRDGYGYDYGFSYGRASGQSIIRFEDAFGQAFDSDDVLMICWMPVARFAGDALTIEWLTSGVAQTQFSIMTLEDRPPEIAP